MIYIQWINCCSGHRHIFLVSSSTVSQHVSQCGTNFPCFSIPVSLQYLMPLCSNMSANVGQISLASVFQYPFSISCHCVPTCQPMWDKFPLLQYSSIPSVSHATVFQHVSQCGTNFPCFSIPSVSHATVFQLDSQCCKRFVHLLGLSTFENSFSINSVNKAKLCSTSHANTQAASRKWLLLR